jgi:hypothetical protein
LALQSRGGNVKFDVKNGKDVIVVDCQGNQVPLVASFDTDTKEAELFLRLSDTPLRIAMGMDAQGKLCALKIKTVLPGCRAVDIRTGEELK